MDALLSFRKWVGIHNVGFFGAAAFFFCFSKMGFTIGCCSVTLAVDDACNWKLNTKPLRKAKKKKKDQKLAFILEKTNSEAFEQTISEPCAAEIPGKKPKKNTKPRRKIVAVIIMTPRANRLKRLDSFFS
jgi:hypothetical protein